MNADRKVLLVEDEVLVAALAVDALEELGYQTIEATTAKAAREIVVRRRRSSPSRSSTSACPTGAATRSRSNCAQLRADLPIIIATGYDGAHLDEALRKQPRTAVLNKPYDIAPVAGRDCSRSCDSAASAIALRGTNPAIRCLLAWHRPPNRAIAAHSQVALTRDCH